MLELTWVPTAAKGEEATMEGSLTVCPPPFPERMRFTAKFAPLAKGLELEENRDKAMIVVAEIAEAAMKHIQKVDLKFKDGSAKAESVEELFGQSEFDGVVTELAMSALKGYSGNSRSR